MAATMSRVNHPFVDVLQELGGDEEVEDERLRDGEKSNDTR